MSRAVSISELYTTNFKTLDFKGEWYDAIGSPQLTGSWIIWGDSGNGKTRFALQLAKYLSKYARVAYNSLEEGASLSMKTAFIETGMEQVKSKIILLDQEPIDELKQRLSKRKSPDIIVIDSLQYADLKYTEYKELRKMFPKKLFVFISHAEGKQPEGRVAKKIRFDSFVKIRVEGYKAFPVSRYGGGKPYVIWQQGAQQYYGELN